MKKKKDYTFLHVLIAIISAFVGSIMAACSEEHAVHWFFGTAIFILIIFGSAPLGDKPKNKPNQ